MHCAVHRKRAPALTTLACSLIWLVASAGQAQEGWALSGRTLVAEDPAYSGETPDFTLEAWIKLDKANGRQRLLAWKQKNSSAALDVENGRKVHFNGPLGNFAADGPEMKDWVHIAATSSAGKGEHAIYVNGKLLERKGGATAKSMNGPGLTIRLGADSGGRARLAGSLGRIGIYRRVLAEGEIGSLAGDRAASPPADLWLGWNPGGPPETARFDAQGERKLALQVIGSAKPSPAPSQRGSGEKIALVGDGLVARGELTSALQLLLGAEYEVKGFGEDGHTVLKSGAKPWLSSQKKREALAFQAHTAVLMFGAADTRAGDRGKLGDWGRDLGEIVLALQQSKGIQSIVLCTPVVEQADTAAGADAALAADKLEVAIRLKALESDAVVVDTAVSATQPSQVDGITLTPPQAAAGALAREITGKNPEWTRLKTPAAAAPNAPVVAATTGSRKKVAFLGDSFAEQMGLVAQLTQDLAATHEVKGFLVSSGSIGPGVGRKLAQQKIMAELKKWGPDSVFLLAGSTDSSIKIDAKNYALLDKDLGELLDQVLASEPKPNLFIGVPPVLPTPALNDLSENRLARNVLPVIRFVAAERKIPLVDFRAKLAGREELHPSGQNHPEGVAAHLAPLLREALEGKLQPPEALKRTRIAIIGDALTAANTLEESVGSSLGFEFEVKGFQTPETRLLNKDEAGFLKSGKLAEARQWLPDILLLTLAENPKKSPTLQEVGNFERDFRAIMNQLAGWTPRPRLIVARPAPFDGKPVPVAPVDKDKKKEPPARPAQGVDASLNRMSSVFRLRLLDPAAIYDQPEGLPTNDKERPGFAAKGYAKQISEELRQELAPK